MQGRKGRMLAVFLLMAVLSGTVFSYGTSKVSAAAWINVQATHPEMNAIKLTWGEVSGAIGYNVYSSRTKTGTYELVSSIKDTSIILNQLNTDEYYYFKVTAYNVKNNERVEIAASDIITERSNRIGIDVSKHNGTIDWNKVKADGVEYAFIRTSYGLNTDLEEKFTTNIQGAINAGVPAGVYIYSTASTIEGVKKEAELVLSLVKGYKLSYPICFDIEADSIHKPLSKRVNTNLTKAFCDVIEKAGYDVMIYTGCNFSSEYLYMNELAGYDFWIPHYGSTDSYVPYGGKYHFKDDQSTNRCANYKNPTRVWQYSERGKVAGISSRVDMNYELDLKEEKTALAYVNLNTKVETYLAGDNETISSIAQKVGVSVQGLVQLNPSYTATSAVKSGSSIVMNTLSLTPTTVTTQIMTANKIKLTFDSVIDADGYEIYHSTSKNGTYKKLATIKELSYVHTSASKTATNYYKVTAFGMVEGVMQKATSAIVSRKTAVSKVGTISAVGKTNTSNTITWSKVSGVTGYKLYSATSKNGTYKLIKTTTSTSYTHTKLTANKTVYYKVKAYLKGTEKTIESAYSTIASAKPTALAPAKNLKISDVTSNSARLTWTKGTGAAEYIIYRSTSKTGTYKKIATIAGNTFLNKNLAANKTYYYKVLAIKTVSGKQTSAGYTAVVSAKTKASGTTSGTITGTTSTAFAAPKITAITGKSKSVYMTWSSVSGAKGYEIYRCETSNATYRKVITKAPTYINNTGLVGNKTYYYKVRAYKVVNGVTTYSPYSAVKSVKTKA